MRPFRTSLLPLSFLVPLEIARAYAEAFLPRSSIVSPKGPAPPNRVPSDQSTTSAKAMSTQFYDTQVATVNYQILFTKRGKEAILDSGTEVVTSAMSGSGFASWRISLFIQKLFHQAAPPAFGAGDGIPRPKEWTNADAIDLAVAVIPWLGDPPPLVPPILWVIGLKPENLKYLQVDYQIVSIFDRKPPTDQIGALREIAAAIKNKP
jgi:hypothetical protein